MDSLRRMTVERICSYTSRIFKEMVTAISKMGRLSNTTRPRGRRGLKRKTFGLSDRVAPAALRPGDGLPLFRPIRDVYLWQRLVAL